MKKSSLKFPLQFNVVVEFHDNVLNLEDVFVTVMDTVGKIDLEVTLQFPLDDISDYNHFASHPMLSKYFRFKLIFFLVL